MKLDYKTNIQLVRLVYDNGQSEIVPTKKALELAKDAWMDLIVVNKNQNPPVVKIGDYSRFLYEQKIALKKNKQKPQKIKEIQLSSNIADNDLNIKIRKAKEFLEKKFKVNVILQLKGREKGSPERGEIVILKFIDSLKDFGLIEEMPKFEGSKWLVTIKHK